MDIVDFEAALEAGDPERATSLYVGPFLDGFFISEAPELERWLDGERARLQRRLAAAAWALAERAERRGSADARALARRAAELDPYDENVHRRLLDFLDRAVTGRVQSKRIRTFEDGWRQISRFNRPPRRGPWWR